LTTGQARGPAPTVVYWCIGVLGLGSITVLAAPLFKLNKSLVPMRSKEMQSTCFAFIFIQIFRWTVCNPVHTDSTPKQETFLAGLQTRPDKNPLDKNPLDKNPLDKNPLDKAVDFELGALWADFNIHLISQSKNGISYTIYINAYIVFLP